MLRKSLFICLFVLFSVAAVGTSFAADNATPVKISIGHILYEANVGTKPLETFSRNVSTRTEGRVVFDIFGNSILGSEAEMLEQIQMGTLSAGMIAVGTLQALDGRLAIEDLPYMWKDVKNAREAYEGEFGSFLGGIMAEYGMKTFGYSEYGMRHISNNIRPIVKPEDLAGIKIRVAQTQLRVDTFEQVKAIPTIISKNELYQALQQNIVDATEGPLSDLLRGYTEVQKYCSLTSHFYTNLMLFMREDVWNQISTEDQAIILEESSAMWKDVCVGNDEADRTALVALKDAKLIVNDGVDIEAMRAQMSPVYEKWSSVFGEALMAVYNKYSGW